MNSKLTFLFLVIASAVFFQSCTNSGEVIHKNITGAASELVVVISKDAWGGASGELIRKSLAQPHVGLPQEEPLFDVIDVPHQAFTEIFKTTRNIVQTRISGNVKNEGVSFRDDVWAYPQATVTIQAKSAAKFEELYKANEEKILSYLLAAEKERLTMGYKKFYEKGVYNVLNEDLGITMKVSPGFRISERGEDFIWLVYDTPKIQQGIIIYTLPYNSDSIFTVKELVSARNQVLKANVPGPTEGSYMTTERRFQQVQNIFEHNNNYSSGMRGLWKVQNDFMGGPYIALAELDATNQRVVVAFGYVYAPSKDKRNLLRQVEAMIYSMKFNDQPKNDKIRSQINMGN